MKRHILLIAVLVFLACSVVGTGGGLIWATAPPPEAAPPPLSFDAKTRLLGPVDLGVIEELKREHGPDGPPNPFFNDPWGDEGSQPPVDPDIILEYYSRVTDIVTAHWVAPEAALPAGLICTVEISVTTGGRADTSKIRQSSGNADFDQSLLTAIEKASPFPPLPPEFKGQTVEVWIKFYSDDMLRLERERKTDRRSAE